MPFRCEHWQASLKGTLLPVVLFGRCMNCSPTYLMVATCILYWPGKYPQFWHVHSTQGNVFPGGLSVKIDFLRLYSSRNHARTEKKARSVTCEGLPLKQDPNYALSNCQLSWCSIEKCLSEIKREGGRETLSICRMLFCHFSLTTKMDLNVGSHQLALTVKKMRHIACCNMC